jgi:hypothetical protein
MFSGFIKSASKIWTWGVTILEAINIVLTPFSSKAFNSYTWGQIISFVFVLSVVGYMIYVEIENKKRPNIKIRPVISNDVVMLEVYNIGGKARFSANADFVEGDKKLLGIPLALCWEPGGENAELENKARKLISISFKYGQDLKTPVMTSRGRQEMFVSIWPHDQWGEPIENTPPAKIGIEISIVSEKNMKKPFERLKFEIKQESFTDISFKYIGCDLRKYKQDESGYIY